MRALFRSAAVIWQDQGEKHKKDRIYDAARLKKRLAHAQPIIKGENRKWEWTHDQAS
jgi:hypothetical protein